MVGLALLFSRAVRSIDCIVDVLGFMPANSFEICTFTFILS